MTNQTIHPCQACGKPYCEHLADEVNRFMSSLERPFFDATKPSLEVAHDVLLGRACRELGIETVEQLRSKVQPDPRVAELDKLGVRSVDDLHRFMRLGYCAKKAYRNKRILARESDIEWFESIAAQRGEG